MLKDELDKHIRLDNTTTKVRILKTNGGSSNAISNAIEKILGYRKRMPKKEWMTSKILDMMEERRLKKTNIQLYNKTNTPEYTSQDKRSKNYKE